MASGRLRTWLRRVRTLLWTAVTLVILLAAVVVGIGKLLMPYSVQYKPQLEAWLSREFEQPVTVEGFTGDWKAFGPRITLENMSLQGEPGGPGEIAIRQAALDIKPLNALISGRPVYTFRIIGADLSLVRMPEGRLELSGLGVSGRGGDGNGTGLGRLARVGELRLEQSSFSYDDDQRDIHLQLIDIDGRLQIDGDDIGMEVRASVSDRSQFRVLGDLDATLLVRLSEDQRLAHAQWHVKSGELMLSDVFKQFPVHELVPSDGWLNAELWGSWEPGAAQEMVGVLDLRDVVLPGEDRPLALDHLNARARWRFNDRRQWRLDLADLRIEENGREWRSEAMTVERNIPGGLGVWVSADRLQAEFPMRLTHRFMATFNARWPRHVPRLASGLVRDFNLVINSDKKLVSATGNFENVDILQWGQWPRMHGISGRADMAWGEGEILLGGAGVRVEWERNFRSPLIADIPGCAVEILWGRTGEWQVDVNRCEIVSEAFLARGRVRFAGNEGKPGIDVNAAFEDVQLDALDDYWPASVMKPTIRSWLGRSLAAGRASTGRLLLRGDMDEWPFRGAEGMLDALVTIEGVTLEYHPEWPAASGIDATLRFRGVSLQAEGSVGSLAGGPVQSVTARIEDLKSPVLDLQYEARTRLPALVSFIGLSPLLKESALELGDYRFTGEARTAGHLRMPLRAEAGTMRLDGRLHLANDGFTHAPSGMSLAGLTGEVRYSHEGLAGPDLEATWLGWPASLAVRADWDAQERFRAELLGTFPASLVVGESPFRDDPMLNRITGDSTWRGTLTAHAPSEPEPLEIWLRLESDLVNIGAALPAPLNKEPGVAWPFSLDYPLRSERPVITARLEPLLSMRVETGASGGRVERAALHFGSEQDIDMPPPGLFDVSGEVDTLDLDGWTDLVIDYFRAERQPGTLTFRQAAVYAERLEFLNRAFPSVGIRAVFDEPLLTANFESQDLAGEVRYSRGEEGTHSLAAEMQRVFMRNPIDEGMSMDTDPSSLPEMHVYVERMGYRGLDLGETRIEAFPQPDGLRIESVEAHSDSLNFQARGDWIGGEFGSRSDFDIVMTSESLGALVSAMDVSSVLEGGQTMVRYDAWWPGPPAAFALESVNGEMTFSVVDGRILNADPGAGRVLGLMSVAALPRRLALDFRDVFEAGFQFDQASGTITLENGTAHTNDFIMESTAATLAIEGSSNLVNKTFDYRMTVRPGVSQALPVIGAIAAGPGGAAAGLALQGLLREALGDAAEARYAIEGPWEDPEVTRIDTPTAGTDDAAARPAPGGKGRDG